MLKAPGVGLAANQIGILKQIVTIFFVDQETKKETQYTLFNPNIISYSQEKIVMEEGCLSLPEQFAEIERPQNIVVRYLDENNKQITKDVVCPSIVVLKARIISLTLFVSILFSRCSIFNSSVPIPCIADNEPPKTL